MSLNLPQLAPHIQQMGETTAQRLSELTAYLPQWIQSLTQIARTDPDLLKEKLEKAGESWSGAIPAVEPIDATYPPPSIPPQLVVLAADGSQIHPDRHAPAHGQIRSLW